MNKKAPVLSEIATFITGNSHFDEHTLHQAKRVIADTYATAFSGVQTAAFCSAIKSNNTLFGEGKFPIWGSGDTSSLQGSIFFNALAISSTDFDEGHRKAVGHPASLLVPTVLILGELVKASFFEILQAVIVGYEIGARFSHARITSKIKSFSTGRWGAIATAATAARLLKLNNEQTIHALSNAAILSPAMIEGSTDVSTGSMSKEGVAWATQAGLQSALLAKDGFSGPYLFVDEVGDYENDKLLQGLGQSWLINSNYFKPYACCRWLHSAIEAVLTIKWKFSFEIAQIAQIKVFVFRRAINLVGSKFPENTVQAQFHLPFVLAVALLYGKVSPLFFTVAFLQKKTIKKLIGITELKASEEYDSVFPGKLPSRVEIILTDGRIFSKEILIAPWDADCQPTDEALKSKFLEQTGELGEKQWSVFFNTEV